MQEQREGLQRHYILLTLNSQLIAGSEATSGDDEGACRAHQVQLARAEVVAHEGQLLRHVLIHAVLEGQADGDTSGDSAWHLS